MNLDQEDDPIGVIPEKETICGKCMKAMHRHSLDEYECDGCGTRTAG